jgi:Arabinose efflux permease
MDCFYSGMKKSLTALAFGTLGLGIAEFVMMGILPDVAKDLHISIPQAGHFISAYALGVCVGAPGDGFGGSYPSAETYSVRFDGYLYLW